VQRPRLSDSLNASLVTSLVEALPATSGTNADKSIYVEYLLRAIGDGVITDSEAQDLMTIALEIGLSIADVSELHLEVFSGMSALAWTDGRLSDFEKSLIDQVAKQLGVGEIELERAKTGKGYFANSGSSVLRKGDLVVLTGTMQPPKEQVAKQIEAFGAQVADSLTKKTNLLVAADPNTLSGKGQKARTWGIPIVSTSQLLSELEA
jgi:DNA polymerase-3 subunit epsilon